jgi:hypothetical protein
VASLDLIPEHDFELSHEVIYPDHTNLSVMQKARLTQLRHQEVLDELRDYGRNYQFLRQIGDFLNSSVELRETFSYGPWIQVNSLSGKWPIEPIHIGVRSVFLKRDLQITPANPRPFTPLNDLVDKSVVAAKKLVHQYPSFLRNSIDQRDRPDRVQSKAIMFDAFVQAPFSWYPSVPASIFEKTKAELNSLLVDFGDYYKDIVEPINQIWNEEAYLEALTTGSLTFTNMTLKSGVQYQTVNLD